MKVAILGSSGSIGSELMRRLSPHYNMIPVNRKTIDLLDHKQVSFWLNKEAPDVIINCASAGVTRSIQDFNLNEYLNNIVVFENFYLNSSKIKKFINVGSGAEFDRCVDIDNIKEEYIKHRFPKDSYGKSKNFISRISLNKKNFYTLRLFGCFHSSEPEFRLFKKYLNNEIKEIEDRKFDYIGIEDFVIVLHHYIKNEPEYSDINCVYPKKLYLSEILKYFGEIDIKSISDKNYTGCGSKLSRLNLPLLGLQKCIENYRENL